MESGKFFTFEEEDFASILSEENGGGRACRTTADDGYVVENFHESREI